MHIPPIHNILLAPPRDSSLPITSPVWQKKRFTQSMMMVNQEYTCAVNKWHQQLSLVEFQTHDRQHRPPSGILTYTVINKLSLNLNYHHYQCQSSHPLIHKQWPYIFVIREMCCCRYSGCYCIICVTIPIGTEFSTILTQEFKTCNIGKY